MAVAIMSAFSFSLHLIFAFHLLLVCTYSYSGLVSFWVAREMNDNDRKELTKWIKRGVECKDKMEKLSVSASTWNFENSECRCRIFLVVIFLYLHILYFTL